jgi:hypothetical protein
VSTVPAPARMKETAFTQAVADIAAGDQAFTVALARALLRSVSVTSLDRRARQRASTLQRHLPRKHLELAAEITAINDRLLDIWRRVHRSKYDWLFLGSDFALVVEVKIWPTTPFNAHQLSSHHRALTDKLSDTAHWHVGLLALAPTEPKREDEISIGRHRAYLGALLWSDARAELAKLAPADPKSATHWRKLLFVIAPGE